MNCNAAYCRVVIGQTGLARARTAKAFPISLLGRAD